MDILTRISILPQVLQDHIATYNVEHRPHMRQICEELDQYYGPDIIEHRQNMHDICHEIDFHELFIVECGNNCGAFINIADDSFIDSRGNLFCSDWCISDCQHSERDYRRQEARIKIEQKKKELELELEQQQDISIS
jgi:hypothetical protein